jgi:transcriptional regulator with XRE-family HTH domain
VIEINIGRRVYDLRKAADMSQYDLVNKLATYGINVRQSHISGVENGESKPSVEMLVGLVYSLNTNADYLLGLTDDPRSIDLMAKTVAKVVNDDAQRAVLREVVARVSALSPENQVYANELLARLFSNVIIERTTS